MNKTMYVYILTNYSKTLYIGVTSNLEKRIFEHKNKKFDSFSKKYNIGKLVYFEIYEDAYTAISREKQLKNWRRDKKVRLIELQNPNWCELNI